jgi:hypothetical protein
MGLVQNHRVASEENLDEFFYVTGVFKLKTRRETHRSQLIVAFLLLQVMSFYMPFICQHGSFDPSRCYCYSHAQDSEGFRITVACRKKIATL